MACPQALSRSRWNGDLHARPAGALAVAAGRFAAAVSVTAGSRTVDAKSVLGVVVASTPPPARPAVRR